jgi:hypothetical protein
MNLSPVLPGCARVDPVAPLGLRPVCPMMAASSIIIAGAFDLRRYFG